MSIIGLSMAALPCCTEGTWKRGVAPRVDWPVFPRSSEHNTVAVGGNRRWTKTARQNVFQSRSPWADQRTRGPAELWGARALHPDESQKTVDHSRIVS